MSNFKLIPNTMSKYLLRKMGFFYQVQHGLEEMILEVCDQDVTFAAGAYIARNGEGYNGTYLIDNGWVVRSKTLPSGVRQIVNVAMPGDFVGLNALLFKDSDFDLHAQTDVRAYKIRPSGMTEIFAKYPTFGAALFWANTYEESMLAERIVSLGRRSAMERTAHVLCEFVSRMEIFDEIDSNAEMFIPLSQSDFADILGLSAVHMNKILRQLEREDIVVFRKGILIINDRASLEQIAGFEDGYAHFTHRADFIRSEPMIDATQ